jgi:hypothetical protein
VTDDGLQDELAAAERRGAARVVEAVSEAARHAPEPVGRWWMTEAAIAARQAVPSGGQA